MNEILEREAQQIWQSQPVEVTQMSVEAIRLRAATFEQRISRKNLREFILCLLVAACFVYFMVTMPELPFRVTWGLFIAGMIWIAVRLRRKGRPRPMPEGLGRSPSLDFFRAELERQRDLLKNVWPWHFGPLVPGYVALNVAYLLKFHRRPDLVELALLDAFFVAVFLFAWKINMRCARSLQRSIDSLPAGEPRH
jgi:hypothetical protein